MPQFGGLLPWVVTMPAAAGAVAFGLAALAALTARQVALSLYRNGLRAAEPPPASWSLVAAALLAATAGALATWVPPGPWREAALGAVYGHSALDLANNIRAAAAVRAVAGSPGGVERWLHLPPRSRLDIALSLHPAVVAILAVVCLLRCDAGLLGFLAGAMAQMALVRRHGERQLAVLWQELAAHAIEQPAPPGTSDSNPG